MVIQRRRQKGDSSLSLCFGVWKKPWWFYFLRRKLERERESVDGVERPTSFANASGRAGEKKPPVVSSPAPRNPCSHGSG
jgi:hypothetical protein